MQSASATRADLLEHKAQIKLAGQGRDLLEQKRAALMKEFFHVADNVMQDAQALQQSSDVARHALARAEVVAGTEAVRSAAIAARAELPLEVETVSVMGVEVLHIGQKPVSRSALGRGYSIAGTSTTIDEAAQAFEVEVETILQLAERELRLTRLAREIQQTSRRLNALEYVLIPQLEAEYEYIQMTLDEQERYDHYRLNLAKRCSSKKRCPNEESAQAL